MKMRKILTLMTLTLTALLLMTGCGDKPAAEQPSGGSQIEGPATPDTPDNGGDAATPDADGQASQLISLMGKEDADVVSALGEGSANTDDAGNLTVREYELELCGLATVTTVSYDAGKASMIISYAAENKFDDWAQALTHELGAPQTETTDNSEGSGTKESTWAVDGVLVSLKDAYGALSLELFPEG